MLTYMNYEISFASCFIGPPRGVCKAGRTNMVPKHENTSDQSLHNVAQVTQTHAHSMVFRALLEGLANCWHPSFWYLCGITLQCSYMSLSLVSMLKLNSWVLWALKGSSIHCGFSDTWVSKEFYPHSTAKVLKYLVVLALDLLNSLVCHI